MLSISGMLGPPSPTPQRPSWYDSTSEHPSESSSVRQLSKTPGPVSRSDHQNHLNAAGSPVASSPSSTRSDSQHRSFSSDASPTLKRKLSFDSPNPRLATSTSPAPKKKRAPRPQYTKEQEDFIWFCRDDLSMSWRKVVELYNNYWHPTDTEPNVRSESGLQSRYYRILDFPVKIRKKKEPSRPDLGLIPSTTRRYPWMGVIQADVEGRKLKERANAGRVEWKEDEEDEEASETERGRGWRGEVRAKVISHTSETDSEVEGEREWEAGSRPSTSSSYDRYELKSFSRSPSHDSMEYRIPRRLSDGPICLPPLRRYVPYMGTIRYERGEDSRRSREKLARPPTQGYKLSVTNLCI